MTTTHRLTAVFEREFATVIRTRVYGVVGVGFVATVVALGLVGGVSGYVGAILNLLTPLAVLLPVFCAALGYRSLLTDRESGEADVLRTFALPRWAYVGGVLLARLTVVVLIVLLALVVVGVAVPLFSRGSSEFLLRRTTYNGPLLFVRFSVLTAIATAVFFTAVTAVSAAASRSRRALALGVLLVVAFTVGLDLVIVAGIATDVFTPDLLPWLLALSPVSAYRGLVLALVVEPATASSLQAGSAFANSLGLVGWFAGSLAAATKLVWT
ncbi:MAG: ABC transporter permease subunit [Haloplanus sp.]